MAPKFFNNHKELIDSLEKNKYELSLSQIKYNEKDQTKQYPFVWVSILNRELRQFHSGFSIVFATSDARLPIVFVAEQSGSTLCRVNESNVPIITAMKIVQDKVRESLPAHQQHMLKPILRTSTHPLYPDSQSISLKTKYAAIDHTKCQVTKVAVKNTLTKFILQLQKLCLHEGEFKFQWTVMAIGGMEPSSPADLPSSCGSSGEQQQTDDDLFNMMADTAEAY
jgi:hypothetical protein